MSIDQQTEFPADDRTVETLVSPLEILAGHEVAVTCVARRGDVHLPDTRTFLEVVPDPGGIRLEGTSFRFIPSLAGEYLARCGILQSSVLDRRGVHLRVRPTSPASLDTLLSATTSQAGTAVVVTCNVFDRFGNAILDHTGVHLEVDDTLWVDPPRGAGFHVRGTRAGDHSVACRLDDWVDADPAILTVTPGIPGASETSVDRVAVGPEERVTVTCAVSDAFGNALHDVSTGVEILAADGSTSVENGLIQAGHSFSATQTGTYYVFCTVPGYRAGDESPALVRLAWGYPCSWTVALAEQDCYANGRPLPLAVAVRDRWGNLVQRPQLILDTTPATQVVTNPEGGFILLAEGSFSIALSVGGQIDAACLELPDSAAQSFVADLRLDATGPQLAVVTPPRGAMLQLGGLGDESVTIQGHAVDTTSAIASLVVNQVSLPIAGGQTNLPFVTQAASRWGLNLVQVAATDACGNRSVLVQSYLRSPAYFAAALTPTSAAEVPHGLLAQLNQPLLDDGERWDLDDLASIAETMLQTSDFNTLVPPGAMLTADALQGGCDDCPWGSTWTDSSYTVTRHPDPGRRITWSGPWISGVAAVDGGLRLQLALANFRFPVRFQGCLRECVVGCQSTQCLSDIDGWAGMDRVNADATLAVSFVGGAPHATVHSVSFATEGLYVSIDCGILQFICDGITGLIVSLLRSQIESALAQAVAQQIPPLLEGMLAGISLASGFDLPSPLDMRLEMRSAIDRLLFCGPSAGLAKPSECPAVSPNPGFGQIGLFAQVYPRERGVTIPAGARGSIRRDGSAPAFASSGYGLGIGLKDDLLNQILWSLWYGGGLELDASEIQALTDTAGYDGISMSLSVRLPPVAMPGRDGHEIDLGIGEAYVDASVDLGRLLGIQGAPPLQLGAYVSMILGAAVTVDPAANVLSIALADSPVVQAQIVSIDDPAYQATMSDVLSQLLRLVLPSVVAGALSSFPLPEIDLRNIANLPAGTDTIWTLDQARLQRVEPYVLIMGDVR